MTSMPDDASREKTPPPSLEPLPTVGSPTADESPSPARARLKIAISVPTRTISLLGLLILIGAIVLAFAYFTVHHRTSAEIAANSNFDRMHYTIESWLKHGYFHFGG